MSVYRFKPDDAWRFAHEQGIPVKQRGDELQFERCPYCKGGANNEKGSFYLSTKTGAYKCFRASCGAKGNMLTLHKEFGFDLGDDVTEYERPKYTWKRFPAPKTPYEPDEPAIEYMNGKRKISIDILKKYEITSQKDDPNIIGFFFYGENGEIEFIKKRAIDPELNGGRKETAVPGMRSILFGMKQCNMENKRLIITEGQIDSLSVATAGFENAVSVPTGKNGMRWIPHCWNWLKNFNEIIVFGDCEHGEITLLSDIQRRFTWMTVKAVQEEDYRHCKDANELLIKHGVEAVQQAVNNAKPIMSEHVVQLADVDYSRKNKERLPTGFEDIDKLLTGGLPFGGLMILSGLRGEGKTTLSSMLVKSALEHDYNTFIYSGEMIKDDVRRWLDLQLAGPDYIEADKNQIYGFTTYNLSRQNRDVISAWLRDKAYIFDDSYFIEKEDEDDTSILEVIETYITQFGCKVVLIDNLMTAIDMEKNRGSNVYEIQSFMCKKLARLARRTGALIILVAHFKKNGDANGDSNDAVSGTADITNLATVVISYGRSAKTRDDQRVLKVTKNRDTGNCDFHGVVMNFDPASKRIFEDTDKGELSVKGSICLSENESFEQVDLDDIPF